LLSEEFRRAGYNSRYRRDLAKETASSAGFEFHIVSCCPLGSDYQQAAAANDSLIDLFFS
jgi:hypothetical protein